MTTQPPRSYTRLAMAIVIAAAVISASVLSYSSFEAKVTKTDVTSITSDSTESCGSSSNLFCVVFDQTGYCGPPQNGPFFVQPWSVTLGGVTEVQPIGGNMDAQSYGTSSKYATIVFAVPLGNYSYDVDPADLFGGTAGTVDVNGTNLLLEVTGPRLASCGPLLTPSPMEQSGPLSTFPAWWLDCEQTNNVTTIVNLNLNASAAFDHINLNQVYKTIINSPSFEVPSFDHGWVVAEWTDSEQGSENGTTVSNLVTGLFVLTPVHKGDNPPGFIIANYNLLTNGVSVTSAESLLGCPSPLH